ncbi:ras-related protein Rab-1A-like [Haemaphysalis longicornis]
MAVASKKDAVFHLLLVGESGVGKSSLLKRFVQGTYKESYSPTSAVDFRTCCIPLEGKTIKLQVNDVPGRQEYRKAIADYYEKADGFIIVFDVTDEESFAGVNDWLLQLDKRGSKDFTKLLVGNKLDMQAERVISFEVAEELANKWGMKYLEVSAKDGSNVAQIFEGIATDINNRLYPPQKRPQKGSKYGEIRRRLEGLNLSRPRIAGLQGRFQSEKVQSEPCDYNLNIILLGDMAVGKSSLMLRFTEDHFSGLYASTIGLDFVS